MPLEHRDVELKIVADQRAAADEALDLVDRLLCWHAAREIDRPQLVDPDALLAGLPSRPHYQLQPLARQDPIALDAGQPRPRADRRAIRSFVLLSVSLCLFAQMT